MKIDSTTATKKRRGRPPGSKNKKNHTLKSKIKPKNSIQKVTDNSIETTIRHLLDMPASTEIKVRLIKAVLEEKI